MKINTRTVEIADDGNTAHYGGWLEVTNDQGLVTKVTCSGNDRSDLQYNDAQLLHALGLDTWPTEIDVASELLDLSQQEYIDPEDTTENLLAWVINQNLGVILEVYVEDDTLVVNLSEPAPDVTVLELDAREVEMLLKLLDGQDGFEAIVKALRGAQ